MSPNGLETLLLATFLFIVVSATSPWETTCSKNALGLVASFQKYPNKIFTGNVLKTANVSTEMECYFHCSRTESCNSVNIREIHTSVDHNMSYPCELLQLKKDRDEDLESRNGWTFSTMLIRYKKEICKNGGFCSSETETRLSKCICPKTSTHLYYGTFCEHRFDAADLYLKFDSLKNVTASESSRNLLPDMTHRGHVDVFYSKELKRNVTYLTGVKESYLDFSFAHMDCFRDIELYETGLSLTLWLNPAFLPSDKKFNIIMATGDQRDAGFLFGFRGKRLRTEFVETRWSTLMDYRISTDIIGTWHHISIVYNRTRGHTRSASFFLNGRLVQKASAVRLDVMVDDYRYLRVGNSVRSHLAENSNVYLYGLEIWRRVLSEQEIAYHSKHVI